MVSEVSPPAPDWLDQLNYIRYAAMNMCDTPFVAYIEVARPIAGEIAIELLQFDWYSFIKRLIRPKQLRSERHGRRGRRGGRRPGGIPEVSDIVAHHVDSERRYRLPDSFGKTAFLFVIDDTIEQAANTAFIIEKSIQLPYQTMLGVLALDPSKCPKQGALLKTGVIEGITALGPEWQAFIIFTTRYSRNINAGTTLNWMPVVGNWTCVLEVSAQAHTDARPMWAIRLLDMTANKVIAQRGPVELNRDDPTTLTCSGYLPEGHVVAWQTSISTSTAGLSDLKFFAVRTG